jgi:hypothetical protein
MIGIKSQSMAPTIIHFNSINIYIQFRRHGVTDVFFILFLGGKKSLISGSLGTDTTVAFLPRMSKVGSEVC